MTTAVLLATGGFGAGIYSFQTRNFAFRLVRDIKKTLEPVAELIIRTGDSLGAPSEHVQPSRGQGEGVTANDRPTDGAMILMVGFFDDENRARLISRSGEIVNEWSLNFTSHFPIDGPRECDKNPLDVDNHGVLLTRRGELVTNYEYCGTVKLDRCDDLLWTLPHKTHHSVTAATAGGYWILGRDNWAAKDHRDRFPPFTQTAAEFMTEDHILRVSEDGNIVEKFSIPRILYDSGLEAVMTANGEDFILAGNTRSELVHSNKVTELTSDLSRYFPMFEAGDLAISLRELNMFAVIDGDTKRVKWHQTGP